jgi:hypothetical protein
LDKEKLKKIKAGNKYKNTFNSSSENRDEGKIKAQLWG